MRILILIITVISLSGCATFNPIPSGYDGPTATIKDTFSNKALSTAHYFELQEVNGNQLPTSFGETRSKNYGKGRNFDAAMLSHQILPEEQAFTISGYKFFGSDIQLMFGDTMAVEGVLSFTPEPNKTYFVKGSLSKAVSEVWIEDIEGNIIGEKFSKTHDKQ